MLHFKRETSDSWTCRWPRVVLVLTVWQFFLLNFLTSLFSGSHSTSRLLKFSPECYKVWVGGFPQKLRAFCFTLSVFTPTLILYILRVFPPYYCPWFDLVTACDLSLLVYVASWRHPDHYQTFLPMLCQKERGSFSCELTCMSCVLINLYFLNFDRVIFILRSQSCHDWKGIEEPNKSETRGWTIDDQAVYVSCIFAQISMTGLCTTTVKTNFWGFSNAISILLKRH